MLQEDICEMCKTEVETIDHLLFACSSTKGTWKDVINMLGIDNQPQQWNTEKDWIRTHTRRKGSKAGILKIAIAETIYGIWRYRNVVIFEANINNTHIARDIIDIVLYRGWM